MQIRTRNQNKDIWIQIESFPMCSAFNFALKLLVRFLKKKKKQLKTMLGRTCDMKGYENALRLRTVLILDNIFNR